MRSPLSFSPSARQGALLLAAAFLTFAVGAACMHSYTVFLIAFIEAFGWSRAKPPSHIRYRSWSAAPRRRWLASWLIGLGPQAPGFDRRRPAVGRSAASAIRRKQSLAGDPAVWRGDDARRQLPRAGGVRSDPVAPLRAQPRHGRGDRAIGQRLCPRIFRAAVAVADRRPGLARRLPRAGRLHGGGVSAARCLVPAFGTGADIVWRRGPRASAPPAGRYARRCARRISGC